MPFTFPDGSTPGTCTVCGATSWSPRSNKCEEHKPVQKPKGESKKKGRPRLDPNGSKSTTTQFVEAASVIDSKTFSGKPPTAAEWEDKLGALVVLLTMTYVEYAVVKPLKMGEPASTNAVANLGMTDEEASTIVEPFGHLIAKSAINKKHGREAIEVLAFAPALLAIMAWADRVSTFRAQFQIEGASDVRTQGPQAEGGEGQTASGVPVANFRGVTDPDQAPSRRSNGNMPHVDEPAESVPTANT